MFAARHVAGLALALISLAAPAAAQQVEDIDLDTATLGDVIRVFGSELGNKPKLVLVQDGELVKKTKLKVVGSGDTGEEGGGPYVDVTLKKAFPGVFTIGVKQKKDILGESMDTIELVAPTIESVEPGMAEVKDEVVLMVRDYGSVGAHKVFVGSKKAKITNEEEVVDEGAPGVLTAVTFKVPKVASGIWPVSVQNRLGTGTLKNALEIGGSTASVGKNSAVINIEGQKPFKAKKKLIGTDQQGGDPGEVNVGLVAGSKKKPKVFGISMPGLLEDLEAGDMFMLADGAEILYSETGKNGTQCVWSSTQNEGDEDIAIQVVTIDEESMVLFICGKIRFAAEVSNGDCDGPEVLCFSGMVTAPSQEEDTMVSGACEPFTDAMGSMTGAFVGAPEESIALADIGGPGTVTFTTGTEDGGGGFPAQVINFTVSLEPGVTPLPATYNNIQVPSGDGLTTFTQQLGLEVWGQKFDEQLNSSMSVTITEVTTAPNNPFGILACISGSFTGSVTKGAGPTEMTQTLSGTFEIPLYSPGFGQ